MSCGVALGAAPVAQAQIPLTAQVHVEASESGQGILRSRGEECFVIVPFHVVERSAGSVAIVGEVRVRANAELERKLPSDLAVLRVGRAQNLPCSQWPAVGNVADAIAGQTNGFLQSRESDGTMSRMPVVIRATDLDSIFVRPVASTDRISKTMSGSSLVVNGSVIGLLQDVQDNEGRVARLDEVVRLSSSFFSPASVTTITRKLLESLPGEYNAGSIIVHIALRPDGVLTSESPGTPVSVLVHERDLRFKVEADPRVVLEFRRNAKGDVFALAVHQPNAVVPAIRHTNERMTAQQAQSVAGTYQVGDAKFHVKVDVKGALTFEVVGNPSVELLFVRDLHFVIRGSAGAYVEFVRDPSGVITGLFVHGATSVFASRFR